MRITKTMEIAVGIFVAGGLLALFFLAMQVSNLSGLSSGPAYHVTAKFENIGGLKVRSAVTVAGVRIGRVSNVEFDSETYEAVVTLAISAKYHSLPEDSSASIFTAGLLGEQYIGLDPGGAEEFLKEGSEIKLTQSALVLEQIIGQLLYSKASEKEG